MSEVRTLNPKAGIKLSEDLVESFEDLAVDNAACQAKFVNFSAAIHLEQKALVARSKELWAEVIFNLGLEGEWRYEGGKVYPMDEPKPK